MKQVLLVRCPKTPCKVRESRDSWNGLYLVLYSLDILPTVPGLNMRKGKEAMGVISKTSSGRGGNRK